MSRSSKLSEWDHLVGVLKDCEVARLAGVTRAAVNKYRIRRGVPSARLLKSPIVGDTFGYLTVVDDAPRRDKKQGRLCVQVRCSCGVQKDVLVQRLLSGNTSSCGCKQRRCGPESPVWKGVGEMSAGYFKNLRNGALERRIAFEVTAEELWDLFVRQNRRCALTGVELKFGRKLVHASSTASVDRVDSSLGYVVGNVQWVHKVVNRMKMDLTESDFVMWCRRVATKADT